ncbi:MAG: cofactor-independent phosphoglycerate mutase [Nitrospirae bacterium]|nr:cofactor-independent phosphoglycerate mutase [Nitrospirota bacterium]
MKFVVLLGDGMADVPIEELGGLTPLQKASTPNMDKLAQEGIIGMARTVPKGFPPGSDVANLSILGYNPADCYTGRAPLEAASIGVELEEGDIAYRCNLVTLKNDDSKVSMDDYSSGHITTPEATELILALKTELESENIKFYPGVSYRHLMVWKGGADDVECTPPHDIIGQGVDKHLPSGNKAAFLIDLMRRSEKILANHPVNKERIKNSKKPATSIWLWGQGRKPQLSTYKEKYGLKGALISAVDLTKGLGIYAGFEIPEVPGVTGWLDTNYSGKADYALNTLKKNDFVYIHVESPDEAGHSGDYKNKLQAIEDFDRLVVGPVMKGLEERFGEYRILLMPDHATPIKIRTHTAEPVPFVVYDSRKKQNNEGVSYSEAIAERKDIMVVEAGYRLMDYLIKEVLI